MEKDYKIQSELQMETINIRGKSTVVSIGIYWAWVQREEIEPFRQLSYKTGLLGTSCIIRCCFHDAPALGEGANQEEDGTRGIRHDWQIRLLRCLSASAFLGDRWVGFQCAASL